MFAVMFLETSHVDILGSHSLFGGIFVGAGSHTLHKHCLTFHTVKHQSS